MADGRARSGSTPDARSDRSRDERAHDRPPAAPRRGRTTRPGCSTAVCRTSTCPTWAGRWPSGPRTSSADRDVTVVTASPAGARAADRGAARPDALGLTIGVDADLHRGGQHLRGQADRRRRRGPARPAPVAVPVESGAALVGRALPGDRRPGCATRSARARDEARGHEALLVSHQLPIWICRLDSEDRRFVARPTPSPVRPGLADLVHVRQPRPRRGHLHRAVRRTSRHAHPRPRGPDRPMPHPLPAARRRPRGWRRPLLAGCAAEQAAAGEPVGRRRRAGLRLRRRDHHDRRRWRTAEQAPALTGTTLDGGTFALSRPAAARSSCSTCGPRGARRAGRRPPISRRSSEELADRASRSSG